MESLTKEETLEIDLALLLEKRAGLDNAPKANYFSLGTGYDRVWVGPTLLKYALDKLAEYEQNKTNQT
jgi:hypothetical protein